MGRLQVWRRGLRYSHSRIGRLALLESRLALFLLMRWRSGSFAPCFARASGIVEQALALVRRRDRDRTICLMQVLLYERIYFRGSSVADARLEPPRGVQREGKILARKPSRPTETAPNRDVGEGLEIDPARKHQVTAPLASKAFVHSRDFRGIPRFSCQNLAPSVYFCV